MKRIVKLVFVLLTGMVVMMAAGPAMGASVELKLAHFMSPMHVQQVHAFEPFAQKVAELSNGEIKVSIFPGAQLANPRTMPDAVRTGIADIGFTIPGQVPGRFPRSSVFEIPFNFNSAVHIAQVFYDIFDEYLAEDYKDYVVLWALSAPLSQVHTVGAPLLGIQDFTGKKVRTSNAIETEAVQLLGGNPVGLPISELSIAMQRGVVDGCFTPYAALLSQQLIDISKHVTEFNFAGALMVMLMNKQKYESLSKAHRNIIDRVATREFGIMAAGAFDAEDEKAVEQGTARGIKFHKLSDSDLAAYRETVAPLAKEWVAKNASAFPAQEILGALIEAARKYQ